MIDGHGDDIWRYGGRIKHNFSTNIHAAFDHSPLMEHIGKSMEAVSNYPEPEPLTLEKKIADVLRCSQPEVMVTNGATEAIYLTAREFSGAKTSIVVPTFREYQDACILHGHELSFVGGIMDIPDDCGLAWICNPNNPTGKVHDRGNLLDMIGNNPDKVYVIDQAYSDYTLLPTLTAEDAVGAGNVILLGSLTKRFAVPGLRIGYAVGCRRLLKRLRRWRMPWSVNGLAIKSAMYLLDHIGNYEIDAASLHSEAERIALELNKCGIRVSPTDCNFILCQLPAGTAGDLKEYLAEEAGILIRDASNFESLGESHFRVAAQTKEENDLLIRHISNYVFLIQNTACSRLDS